MATHITPEGLALDARTDVHLRRCAALRQLVEAGVLRGGGGDGGTGGGGGSEDDGDGDGEDRAPPRDLVCLVDLDALERGARHLQRGAGFPPQTLHTFAVKANPSEGVLRAFARLGIGAEVASLGELEAALAAPFPPGRVVFDSPAKTRRELRRALRAGVRVNLDSLAEIERVAAMLEGTGWGRAMLAEGAGGHGGAPAGGGEGGDGNRGGDERGGAPPPPAPAAPPPLPASFPVIGVRVNPQVGAGSIAALSTSTDDSKFGVPIGPGGERARLLAAFGRHRWLRALHLHVGSQGVPLEAVAEGAARAWAFARELPGGGATRLAAFDVGGGTPVDFSSDGADACEAPFSELARLLRARVPELWGAGAAAGEGEEEEGGGGGGGGRAPPPPPPPPLLVTENGRALVAKAGCAAARVEYVKHDDDKDGEEEETEGEGEGEGAGQGEGEAGGQAGGSSAQGRPRRRRPIAVCHMGADLLMRACYLPAQWSLRAFVVDGATFAPRETAAGAAAGAADGKEGGGGGDGKEGGSWRPQDVAGPLCFQGDRLAVARRMPRARPGDWVVVADAGAYALSMWSHYNSRQAPAVYGYRTGKREAGAATERAAAERAATERAAAPGDGAAAAAADGAAGGSGQLELELLRRGDTIGDVLAFWAAGDERPGGERGSRRGE